MGVRVLQKSPGIALELVGRCPYIGNGDAQDSLMQQVSVSLKFGAAPAW